MSLIERSTRTRSTPTGSYEYESMNMTAVAVSSKRNIPTARLQELVKASALHPHLTLSLER
eukprot:scaffold244374_cov17-Prasinocladus_malaysianus.AAC.1